ncbi:MAG: AI-2E family transporter [Chloroflexi bacterium]|nr:AI-2E family transporter [Chloroflexota bacterium]
MTTGSPGAALQDVGEVGLARALYRGGAFLVAIVILTLLGIELKWVVVQVFAASIVAAGMAPVVRRLSDPLRTAGWRWRPPAALVVLLIYVVVGVFVLVLGVLFLNIVLAQGGTLISRVPEFAIKLQTAYASVIGRSEVLRELDPLSMLGGTSAISQWVIGFLRQVLNVAGLLFALFGGAINVIFVLFMALYLSVDAPAMRDYMVVFAPRARQVQMRRVTTNISSRLGQWVVGEMVLCLIVGIGAGIGLGLIGVPGASLLAVVWAIAELIPGIGPFISAVPSILLGFLAGPETGVLATIFTLVWSQIENNVLVPRVMSHAVKLNPLVVLVALLIGNQLLGLAGALFAIPAAAAVAVIVDELHQERVMQLQADTPAADVDFGESCLSRE